MKRKNNIEYLSKDILDVEFMRSFGNLYRLQLFLASSRVNIKDRFVTTPSLSQRCYTVLSVVLHLGLDYIIVCNYNYLLIENETIFQLCACVTGLQTLTFVCNIIHVRFVNSDANVAFFVKLQQVDRSMKVDHNKTVADLLVRTGILSLTSFLPIFGVLLAVISVKGIAALWPYIGIIYSQFTFGIEVITCSNIITYFFIRVRFINSIMKNYMKQKKVGHLKVSRKQRVFSSVFATDVFMRRLAAKTHNFMSSETDTYLKGILDGFSKFQEIYRFQVFILCCKLVASTLLTFELLLLAVQNENAGLWDSLTPSFFTLIDLLLALILCIRCESFLREVKETKRLAITVMSIQFDGRLRDKARKMLKLIEEMPPRFSVYEMWQLDANVLLQMTMLLTSFIVTQLQFAFL